MRRAERSGPARRFFDAWSYIYDLPVVQWATYRPVHNAVLDALAAGPATRILDLGCGTGQLAARIRHGLPGARVTGCDFSAGMLRRAAARAGTGAWVQADASRLPFADGAFDAITSTEAFHWFPDQPTALRECYRVLAPGGRLIVALVNPPAAVVGRVAHTLSQILGQPFYWPTAREMRRGVEAAGFRLQRQQRIVRLPGLLLLPTLTCAVRPARHSAPNPRPGKRRRNGYDFRQILLPRHTYHP